MFNNKFMNIVFGAYFMAILFLICNLIYNFVVFVPIEKGKIIEKFFKPASIIYLPLNTGNGIVCFPQRSKEKWVVRVKNGDENKWDIPENIYNRIKLGDTLGFDKENFKYLR